MTFTEIKANVRNDLNDSGVTAYSEADINDSVQDAYDDIVARTKCIKKVTTLDWEANLSYYDFRSLVTDFMSTLAIYNNVNNRWLQDNQTYRHFDLSDDRWELRLGTPEYWAALNWQLVAITPKYATAAGTFDLHYHASAPTVVDEETPLIATDMQKLVEFYSVADLLEQFEEYAKAMKFWALYENEENGLPAYRSRVKQLARQDLMIRM